MPLCAYQAGGEDGSSYGQPKYLFTSAEDCIPTRGQPDGGVGAPCKGGIGTDMSYTALAEVDLS